MGHIRVAARSVVVDSVDQRCRRWSCLFVTAGGYLSRTRALLPPRRLSACDRLTRSRGRCPLNHNESSGRCCDLVALRTSTEMDLACRQFLGFYNLVTDKAREAELRGSWLLAILVRLTSPLSGLARGSRDSHAMSLLYLSFSLWPARCSIRLPVELYDLRSVDQSVQHRHHDLRVS